MVKRLVRMLRAWILGGCCEVLSRQCTNSGIWVCLYRVGWNVYIIWLVGFMAADDYRLDMYENIRDMRHEIAATHDRKCLVQKKTRSQYIQSLREKAQSPYQAFFPVSRRDHCSQSNDEPQPQQTLPHPKTAFKLRARSALYDDGFPPTVARDSETTSSQSLKDLYR
jgi:hypothetical protein